MPFRVNNLQLLKPITSGVPSELLTATPSELLTATPSELLTATLSEQLTAWEMNYKRLDK